MRRAVTPWILSLWFLTFAIQGFCSDYGFEVKSAELVPVDETYVLNADIEYRFSETAIEALEHGVPLTLSVRFRLNRQRHYWLNETVASEVRRLRIRYHPLARRFQLIPEASGTAQSFASLDALLEAMGTIRGWVMLQKDQIEPDEEYWATLSVDLDIEALPLPLRSLAYLSPSWYLASQKFQWRVAN